MKKFKLLEDVFSKELMDVIKKDTKIYLVEQPAAPTKEPKTTPAPTTTPSPSKPTREPFKPPKPIVKPKPKAKKRDDEDIQEAYEDEAHPSTQQFWKDLKSKDNEHAFAKHPILALHGDRLSKSGHDHHGDTRFNPMKFQQLVMQVMELEAPHKKELEDLAKKITIEIWGIDEEMLKADLIQNPGDIQDSLDGGDEEEEDVEITPELRDQINKRITMNTMTQGAAVHQMASMHHLIKSELDNIDERLVPAYSKIAKLAHKSYWLIDIAAMAAMLKNMSVGSSDVEWMQNESGEEEPVVVARALIFPVLAQELSKGVMELLTMHGLSSQDEETQRAVIKHGDSLADEPYLIQVGPELWRKFLKVVPRDVELSHVIAALSVESPQDVHDIIDAVIDNPDMAEEMLAALMRDDTDAEDVLDLVDDDDDLTFT